MESSTRKKRRSEAAREYLAVDHVHLDGFKGALQVEGGGSPERVVALVLTSWRLPGWVGAPFTMLTGGDGFDFSLEEILSDEEKELSGTSSSNKKEVFSVKWPNRRLYYDSNRGTNRCDDHHASGYRETLRALMNDAVAKSEWWRGRVVIDIFDHARCHTVIASRAVGSPAASGGKRARPRNVRLRLLFASGPGASRSSHAGMGFPDARDVCSRRGFGRATEVIESPRPVFLTPVPYVDLVARQFPHQVPFKRIPLAAQEAKSTTRQFFSERVVLDLNHPLPALPRLDLELRYPGSDEDASEDSEATDAYFSASLISLCPAPDANALSWLQMLPAAGLLPLRGALRQQQSERKSSSPASTAP